MTTGRYSPLHMDFRVTQEFKLNGDPPPQAATDRLRARLREAAPEANSVLELGVGRMVLAMTFDEPDAEAALERARRCAGAVLGGAAVHIHVEPGMKCQT